jgi:hypothetical protein
MLPAVDSPRGPSLPPHLARFLEPGEAVLDLLPLSPAARMTPGHVGLAALAGAAIGGALLAALAAWFPHAAPEERLGAGIAAGMFFCLPLLALALAWRESRVAAAVLTSRHLLLSGPTGVERSLDPFEIRRIDVVPTHGRYGALFVGPPPRPPLPGPSDTLPPLLKGPLSGLRLGGPEEEEPAGPGIELPPQRDPEAAARRVAAWAEARTAAWRDWLLARLAEAAEGRPDPAALRVLPRPHLGLTIALPAAWQAEARVPVLGWRPLHAAPPGWTALRAYGPAWSRFEVAVRDGPLAAAAEELAAALGGDEVEAAAVAIGPWRGVAATARGAGEARPGVAVMVHGRWSLRGRLLGLPPPAPARPALRREILLDAGTRHYHLALHGHADAPEAWAVLEAVAAALRPA